MQQTRPFPLVTNRGKVTRPRPAQGVVCRPLLGERLDVTWNVPLGIVVAPAGYGKSTLARNWAEANRERVGWLTVDATDNEPDRFVQGVLAAIAEVQPDRILNTRSLLDRPSQPDIAELAETLADELIDLDDDLTIVIDEAEFLVSPEAWDFVDTLVRLAPPRFHLLLVSRVDPPLPLARLRIRQQLNEIRGTDLLFSPEETSQVLSMQGAQVTDQYVTELQQAIHGWPAGVRLALLGHSATNAEPASLEDRPDTSRGFILDTLAEEVFARMPEEIRNDLMAMTIVDEVSPALLDRLAGGTPTAQHSLDLVRGSGIFAPAATRGNGWFRLHPLFKDLFNRQLTTHLTRRDIDQLHLRASDWYEQEGMIQEAVEHRLAGGDVAGVIQLLAVAIPAMIESENWGVAAKWLDAVPEEIVATTPELALGRLWVLFMRGNWMAMRAKRMETRAFLETLDQSDPQVGQWLAEIDVLEAAEHNTNPQDPAAAHNLVLSAIPHLNPARRWVSGHADFNAAWALDVMGEHARSDAAFEQAIVSRGSRFDAGLARVWIGRCLTVRDRGNFVQLEDFGADLAMLASENNLPITRGWALMFQGMAAYHRNDLDRAERLLAEMARDHRQIHLSCLREGMNMLAGIYRARGESTESAAVIRRLREILVEQDAIEMLPLIASLETYLTYLDNPAEAFPGCGQSEIAQVVAMTPKADFHPILPEVLICAGSGVPARAARALTLAEAFEERVTSIHLDMWTPRARALRAVATSATGDEAAAIDLMRSALAMPVAANFHRDFLDLGPIATALYRKLVDDPAVGAFARSLVPADSGVTVPDPATGAQAPRGRGAYAVQTLLTDRELNVLECLDRRLSYKEIADELYISPLTVKRHAGNIYDKLGARNRREAVSTAREMGWVPPVPR